MTYGGSVPQEWVNALAPHCSKDHNQGLTIAEQLLRNPETRPALVKAFNGRKLSQADTDSLPAGVAAVFSSSGD